MTANLGPSLFDSPPAPEAKMTTALVERPLEPQQGTAPLVAFIQSAMTNPEVDPERLKGYMDIYERAEANAAADAYGNALALFQAKCPQIVKERQIDLDQGKGPMYASLDDIMRVIKPLLGELELSVTFSASVTDAGQMKAICSVRKGRHVEHSEITLAVPTQMRVNDTQKMGAALSYAKRYALCAALNIVVTDEDRDGAGLVETIDDKQIVALNEWLDQIPNGLQPFLKYMGVASLSAISVRDFDKAIDALRRKAKAK